MKSKAKKTKQIKKLLENFSGVATKAFGTRTRKIIGFEVLDHEDITSSISALLEVCYYTLDGNGSFVFPKHDTKSQMSCVSKVLEMVIDLLPHEQMCCLDQITQILASEKKKIREQHTNDLKLQNHEERKEISGSSPIKRD